jgi:hypothetical protein
MKIRTLGAIIAIMLFALKGQAYTLTINVSDFDGPVSATIELGDTVKWIWTGGIHNTVSNSGPSGYIPWSVALDSAHPSFTYVPTVVGTYIFGCNEFFHHSRHYRSDLRVKQPSSNPYRVAVYSDVNYICGYQMDA